SNTACSSACSNCASPNLSLSDWAGCNPGSCSPLLTLGGARKTCCVLRSCREAGGYVSTSNGGPQARLPQLDWTAQVFVCKHLRRKQLPEMCRTRFREAE